MGANAHDQVETFQNTFSYISSLSIYSVLDLWEKVKKSLGRSPWIFVVNYCTLNTASWGLEFSRLETPILKPLQKNRRPQQEKWFNL